MESVGPGYLQATRYGHTTTYPTLTFMHTDQEVIDAVRSFNIGTISTRSWRKVQHPNQRNRPCLLPCVMIMYWESKTTSLTWCKEVYILHDTLSTLTYCRQCTVKCHYSFKCMYFLSVLELYNIYIVIHYKIDLQIHINERNFKVLLFFAATCCLHLVSARLICLEQRR